MADTHNQRIRMHSPHQGQRPGDVRDYDEVKAKSPQAKEAQALDLV